MLRISVGIILGLALGLSMSAHAQTISGSGYLIGWEVIKNGSVVCADPYVSEGEDIIECD